MVHLGAKKKSVLGLAHSWHVNTQNNEMVCWSVKVVVRTIYIYIYMVLACQACAFLYM